MEVLIQNFSYITWQMLAMWAIGGVLISNVGWRATFMIYAAVMAVTMLPTVLS